GCPLRGDPAPGLFLPGPRALSDVVADRQVLFLDSANLSVAREQNRRMGAAMRYTSMAFDAVGRRFTGCPRVFMRVIISMFLAGVIGVAACANIQGASSRPENGSNDLAAWNDSLRQAGATAKEVRDFDALVQRQPPDVVSRWRDNISASPNFFEQ